MTESNSAKARRQKWSSWFSGNQWYTDVETVEVLASEYDALVAQSAHPIVPEDVRAAAERVADPNPPRGYIHGDAACEFCYDRDAEAVARFVLSLDPAPQPGKADDR
jgi:hypothetical protein